MKINMKNVTSLEIKEILLKMANHFLLNISQEKNHGYMQK